MDVRVEEAGQEQATGEIDVLGHRTDRLAYVVTDRDDPAGGHRQSGGERAVGAPDPPAAEHEVHVVVRLPRHASSTDFVPSSAQHTGFDG